MPASQNSIRALIIDDNAPSALVLRQLLSIEGVEAISLGTARALAVELDRLTGLDIVFLDLEMPHINGYDALAIIRAHPTCAATRVVAYSVHISELPTAVEIGFDGFLGKPLNAEAFPAQLAAILRGERIHYVP